MPNNPLNYAKITLNKSTRKAEAEILVPGKEITWLNISANKPGGKIKVTGIDPAGNTLFSKDYVGNATKRYGERLSLPLTHDKCKIEIQGLEEGPDSFDVYLD